MLAAVGRRDEQRCATDLDPLALRAAHARAGRPLHDIERALAAAEHDGAVELDVLARAAQIAAHAAARVAIAQPPQWTRAVLPDCPTAPWLAVRWDTAVASLAIEAARQAQDLDPDRRARVAQLASGDELADIWLPTMLRSLIEHAGRAAASQDLFDQPPRWLEGHIAALARHGVLGVGSPRPGSLVGLYRDAADYPKEMERHGAGGAARRVRSPARIATMQAQQTSGAMGSARDAQHACPPRRRGVGAAARASAWLTRPVRRGSRIGPTYRVMSNPYQAACSRPAYVVHMSQTFVLLAFRRARMDIDSIWRTIHGERSGLADLLETLSDEQWNAPSLCEGWTVGDIASHATWPARFRLWPGAAQVVRHRFDQNRLALADVDARRALPRDEVIRQLRWSATTRAKVFFLHPLDPLTDILVHGQDIAIPLGIARRMPTEAAVAVADGLFSLRAQIEFHARRTATGLCIRATNAEWEHGDGPTTAATIDAIVLAFTGRTIALSDFTGPGAAELALRFTIRTAERDTRDG